MKTILSSALFFAALGTGNANAVIINTAVSNLTPTAQNFTGALGAINDVAQFNFTLSQTSDVRFETTSWAGITGSFNPQLSLFNSTGTLIAWNLDNGSAAPDSETLTSADALIDSTKHPTSNTPDPILHNLPFADGSFEFINLPGALAAGSYTLALTADGNDWISAQNPNWNATTGFDERSGAVKPINTWSANGQANANLQYALNLSATPAAVPLPAAVWLFGSGLFGVLWQGKKRAQRA